MRIGVDLGGTKIEGIILGADGNAEHVVRIATPRDNYSQTVAAICNLINDLDALAGRTLPVGIGTPGCVSAVTGKMKNCNSTWLNQKPLFADLQSQLGERLKLENDANCFALSEALWGSARNAEVVFGVILGTGTGAGLVCDGKLVTGPNGISGEWGHNPVPGFSSQLFKGSRHCYCGKVNCVETFLSGPGLQQTVREQWGLDYTAHEVYRLAENGNQSCQQALALYCRQLAACLAVVINIIDPEVVVFGGGLSNMKMIFNSLPEMIRPYIFSDAMETRFLPPTFGDASGARGAASLWPETSAGQTTTRD